jgi:hypothetical protein
MVFNILIKIFLILFFGVHSAPPPPPGRLRLGGRLAFLRLGGLRLDALALDVLFTFKSFYVNGLEGCFYLKLSKQIKQSIVTRDTRIFSTYPQHVSTLPFPVTPFIPCESSVNIPQALSSCCLPSGVACSTYLLLSVVTILSA